MIEAFLVLGGMGLIIGAGLAVASKVFYVYVDPTVEKIDDLLPGANCGGCGLPGCAANAEAIVAGKASPDSCVAGGSELAEAIAEVMGMKIEAKEPDIAISGCTYGVNDAALKFSYDGLSSCQAAAMLYGGMKECRIGCLGLGSCAAACPFGAITMGKNGLPVVDEIKCTGCGTCERVCPKNIITLSSVTRRILKEYTTDDCTTPCQRACPAGINISEYIHQIAEKNYHKSVQVIKERNPFPTVIGRICPRPCETDCRRQLIDEPVAINFLKRFVADYEMQNNDRVLPFKAPETDRRVAIVGGGVEGLSTAFFTARLGHSPTVFEATEKLGGLLKTAIAQYRLPHDILDWDIAGIIEMGVETRTRQTLGKDFTIASLLAGDYETVFLAAGGWDSRTKRLKDAAPEETVPGTFLLIDLLKTGADNKYQLNIAKNVVIAESGKLTADAVKACKTLGAEKVTVVFKNSKQTAALDESEIISLEADGVTIMFNSTITRLAGKGNNLTGITVITNTVNTDTGIDAGTLILESGRLPELIFALPKSDEAENGENKTPKMPADQLEWIAATSYKNPEHGLLKGLLTKGDVITDFSAAIRAIGAGRRAAASIHKILYDMDLELPSHAVTQQTTLQNVDHLENVTPIVRQIMPLNNVNDIPKMSPEIEKGFTEQMAVAEANRCLKCGLICYSDQVVTIREAS
ncbi:MAG: RnfABCDGE type electron transport complex subunit B [Desulfobacteraceae bacterium]|nr:RnfABCDGE type electron transport complex subunit B [Desulfobacteraceae bacterium]MBC2754272.1 RnfABCDGE type electron transport complex subunit B [Desulfobacteraceae bacterium]